MTDVQNCPRTVRAGQYEVPQMHRIARTQRQNIAYRRLAVAIVGVDIATLTRELRKRRFESLDTSKAA